MAGSPAKQPAMLSHGHPKQMAAAAAGERPDIAPGMATALPFPQPPA